MRPAQTALLDETFVLLCGEFHGRVLPNGATGLSEDCQKDDWTMTLPTVLSNYFFAVNRKNRQIWRKKALESLADWRDRQLRCPHLAMGNVEKLGAAFQASEQRLVRAGHEGLAAKFLDDVE